MRYWVANKTGYSFGRTSFDSRKIWTLRSTWCKLIGMTPLKVWLHDLKCTIAEDRLLHQWHQRNRRALDQVKRYEARLDQVQARAAAPQLSGMARRLANLTQAGREAAWSQYRGQKAVLMRQLYQLLETGQEYTLRELGAALGISHQSVKRYRVELVAGGLLPA